MKIKKEKLLINKTLLIFLLFLYIFTPLILLPFNIIHVLFLISIFFLLKNYSGLFFSTLKTRTLSIFIIFQLILAIYAFILDIIVDNSNSYAYNFFLLIIEIIPIAIYISILINNLRVNQYKIYNVILNVGMIQVIFTFITIMFPDIRKWIFENSHSYILIETFNDLSSSRMYGLGRGYTFSMPLFQGFCIIIATTLGIYRSKKYFFLVPFYIISIVLNARIALLSIPIIVFVLFFFRFKKHYIEQLILLGSFIFIIFLSIQFVKNKSESDSEYDTYDWINAGFDEIISFNNGEVKGNMIALTNTMWFIPDLKYIYFGTGENVFGKKDKGSDIGYVINLYYGGIFFSVILYYSYFSFLYKSSNNDIIKKIILYSIIIYLFIANIKGNVFYPNEVINGVILFVIYFKVTELFPKNSINPKITSPLKMYQT